MLKAMIFDMDDVIINSIKIEFPAWERLFSDFGQKLDLKVYKSFLGMKSVELIKRFIPVVKDEELSSLANRKEIYFIELLKKEGISMTPGVIDFLDSVKGRYGLAIATAAPDMKLNEILELIHLKRYFKVIITADHIAKGKPDPEIFLKAAERLKVSPRDCVVFEDAPNCVRAAKAGGMKCVAITTTHTKGELKEADLVIDSFSDIDVSKIKKLF
ncbi:MAG: HAD family phosphatase [archaeon]